jgi:membrane protein DedA with SNARE-associated domain
MDGTLQQTVDSLLAYGEFWATPILALAACVEYLFPPFPGDTVTLAGAVLARLGGWSYPLVYLALLAGNVAGAAGDYAFGRKALNRERLLRSQRVARKEDSLDRIIAGYRRFGPALLIVNRFLPGIRALFFVAAGIAELPFRTVMFYAAVSAAAWNALLLLAGYFIGDRLPLLEELFRTYFHIVWVVVVVGAIAILIQWRQKR